MKTFVSFIFLLALIGLGLMIGRGQPQSTNPPSSDDSTVSNETTDSPEASSPTTEGSTAQGNLSGKLFVYRQSGRDGIIESMDVATKQKKTIFSDKNSQLKIQSVSNLNGPGDSLILQLGRPEESTGQLVAIKTDGDGKKTTLINDFASSEPPVVSPDGTKLAFVSFSNADPNFGFSLIIADIDGKNRKTITTDSSGISQLRFSPDGKQIAFLKGASASSTGVVTVPVSGGKLTTLYDLKDKIINDFDWSSVGLLTVTASPAGRKAATESEVYAIDPKVKTNLQITKNSQPELTPVIAPDASGLAYIQTKGDDRTGNVIVVGPDGKNPQTLGTANQLIGWVKE